MASNKDIDSGWAWVVLGASIFNLTVLGAMTISIGMFQTEFLKHFEGSTAYTSLACSLCASLQSLLAPLASVLCNVGGIRTAMMAGAAVLSLGMISASFANNLLQLLMCFGIVAGSGFGIVYTPSVIAVGHYFKKNRVLANGITLSSTGFGMMSGPHLIGWLIDQYGWRFTLVVFSCIIAQIIVSGALMFPVNGNSRIDCRFLCSQHPVNSINVHATDDRTSERKPYDKMFSSCWRNRCTGVCRKEDNRSGESNIVWGKAALWILGTNSFLQMMGYSTQIVHFPSYVQSVGVSHTKVPSLFTAYGIAVTSSRILGGIVYNKAKVQIILVYMIGQGLMGIIVILMPLFGHGFAELILYQVVFGACYGSTFILVTPIVIEMFGVDNLATVFGFLLFLGGISFLIGPTIAGELYDVTSSYSSGFHIGGLMILIGSLILIPLPILIKRSIRRDRRQRERENLLNVEKASAELPSQNLETKC